MQNPKIFIVIAAYNEEKAIAKVIDDLHNHGYQNIIVVDDGSQDKTAPVAELKGATVLKHIINRGQGAALRTGIEYALDQGADIIITFDADGQHQAKDIKNLIQPIINNEADIVLGSRFLGDTESNVPFWRKLFLKAGALSFRLMFGVKVTDSHNGFRALSRKAAQAIEITSDRMEHASQIIEEIAKKRLRYKEIPVTIIYTDYSQEKGQSTLNAFKIFTKTILRRLIK